MTDTEKDPRIEAVAKLLFTGPLRHYDLTEIERHVLSRASGLPWWMRVYEAARLVRGRLLEVVHR
jgi:hypothetical protein